MLSAEYAVLNGALALAIPTCHGQIMKVKQTRKSDLFWKSYDKDRNQWFTAQISLYDFSAVKTTDEDKAAHLSKLLKGAVRQNSEFLSKWNGFDVETELEFDLDWGLGSSSTLTHLVAQWAGVNPLLLHFDVSKGSGYDVAAAGVDLPITYQLGDESVNYQEVDFDPIFKDQLYFIHLNKKQDSEAAVALFHKKAKQKKTLVKKLSGLTEDMLKCRDLKKFCEIITAHEAYVAEHMGLDTVTMDHDLADFDGAVKSLGAWGGDFIMAAGHGQEAEIRTYFESKGFGTIIPYGEMIYQPKVVPVV